MTFITFGLFALVLQAATLETNTIFYLLSQQKIESFAEFIRKQTGNKLQSFQTVAAV